jgi:hypothetical protein
LNDFAEKINSNKLFHRSKVLLGNKQSVVSTVQEKNKEDPINPKISNPNNISSTKSSLDKSINQVFQSLSKLKNSSLPLKKKDNINNPSTFILKNLTSVSNSIYSESQQESLQNNTLLEMNKILTLGRQMDNSQNLNHRLFNLRKGSYLTKENSHSVIKDVFQDDLSFIAGKNSVNNRNESATSKHKGLSSKLSGQSDNISKILRNLEHQNVQQSKQSTNLDFKVKVTSEELKQKLDGLRDITESFVDIKNLPKYRETLIDLHKHLNGSTNQTLGEKDGIKLDTGSRVLGSNEVNQQSMSRILSTQTGSQIRNKKNQHPPFENDSPERQILQRNLVEEISYKNIHKAREISEFECQSPTTKNIEKKVNLKSSKSMSNALIHFKSESTVKGPNAVLVSSNNMTNKKFEKPKKKQVEANFNSNKKIQNKRRYSNHKTTNKKMTKKKSFSTQKKTLGGYKSKTKSPSKFKSNSRSPSKFTKQKKTRNLDIKNSLWKNEKSSKSRNTRHLVSLMKNYNYSKMNIKNVTKPFKKLLLPNYTISHLKKS